MNERSLPLLPIGVLALLVILTFWLSRFVQQGGNRADAKMRHDPDLIIEALAARKLSATGEVEYKLRADKLVHYADDDSSKVAGVLFTSVQPGKPLLTARAPLGSLYHGTDTIVLQGNVEMIVEATAKHSQSVLRTPTMILETDKNIARTDAGVTIDNGNSHAVAASLLLNTDTRHWTSNKGVLTLRKAQ